MLKTAIVDALRQAFDNYPVADLTNPTIDIEYPVEQASFPNIWVNYADTEKVRPVGINSGETIGNLVPNADNPNEMYSRFFRYIAQGTITLTIGAMSSLERDRLFDQVVRIIEMGHEDPATQVFRQRMENSPYANIGFVYDSLMVGGDGAAPGTPWGTDDMLYELSVSTDLMCEFFIEPTTGELVLLSKINVEGTAVENFGPPDPSETPFWPGQGTPADL